MVVAPMFKLVKALAVAVGAFSLSGCLTIQAIEPVIDAPEQFRSDVTVAVEFAVPGAIGFRCAERGATFLGLPGLNSGACSDRTLITMLDPCYTLTAGPYATVLCDGLKQQRADAALEKSLPVVTMAATPSPFLVPVAYAPKTERPAVRKPAATSPGQWSSLVVEFVRPDSVEERCAERGAKIFEADAAMMACADRMLLTIANPCGLNASSWYIRTLCHEIGHANGWAPDHHAGPAPIVLKAASESPQAIALAALQTPSAPVIAETPVLLVEPTDAVEFATTVADVDTAKARLLTAMLGAASIGREFNRQISLWGADRWQTVTQEFHAHAASSGPNDYASRSEARSNHMLGIGLRGQSADSLGGSRMVTFGH